MNIEFNGIIKEMMVEKQINDNFSVRELVITIDENTQYPQDIVLQATNTKISLLDKLEIGQKLIFKCNIRGSKTKEGRVFNQFLLWSI